MDIPSEYIRTIMENFNANALSMISAIGQFALFVLLYILANRKNLNVVKYLAVSLLFGSLFAIMAYIYNLLYLTIYWDYDLLWDLSAIPTMFQLIFLSIFVDKVMGETISWKRIAFLVAYCTFFTALFLYANPLFVEYRLQRSITYTEWTNLNLYNGTWGIHQIYEIYYGFSDCVAYFLYLVLGVYLIRELRYVSQEIRIPTLVLALCLIALVVPLALNNFLIEFFGIYLFSNLAIMAIILLVIIMGIAYWHPEILNLLNVKAKRLLVISNLNGVPVFDQQFLHMTKDVDDSLLAGLLQALMDLGQEIFSTRMLQEIRIAGGILILEHTPNVTVAFLSEHISDLLRNSLHNFTTKFCERYQNDLEKFNGNVVPFMNSKDLIKECFPGLAFRNLI